MWRRQGLHDHIVRDLPALLRPDDLLVVNDTKVIPAQLTAMRGAAKIGITLDRRLDDGAWRVLLRNAKRVKQGDTLVIDPEFSAEVAEMLEGGAAMLRFAADDFYAALARSGALALPPYIARPDGITAQDKSDYQTLFAAHEGAVAAPTAGLHFTPELLAGLQARGIEMAQVTLHVGAGTFLPVRVERIEEHKMHAERGFITPETAARINAAKAAGRRIIPIGTTALRLLESAASRKGVLKPFDSETDIFIIPATASRSRMLCSPISTCPIPPADAGLRLRRARSGSRRPMPTPSRPGTGFTPTAMPVCWKRPHRAQTIRRSTLHFKIYPRQMGRQTGLRRLIWHIRANPANPHRMTGSEFSFTLAGQDGAARAGLLQHRPWRRAHPHLHGRGHRWHGEGHDGGRRARHGCEHRARQHLPPHAPPHGRARGAAGGPA